MIKNFEQYCNIYNICSDNSILKKYINVANKIIEQKTSKKEYKITTYHRHGYLFYYFDKFIKNKLSLEDFFLLGDITSNHNILEYQKKNEPNVKSIEIIYTKFQEGKNDIKESLIIVDDWANNWFNFNYPGEESVVKELASKQGSELIIL